MNEAAKQAAKFLKSTLRLPASTFPPRPPPADLQKYLQRCTDDLYSWQRRSRPAENTFVLHDGPPYANGDLHVGHALNKIVKDIICRSKLAEGRRVDYTPGWDCHGLPIELKALEKHGWKRGHGIDAVSIRQAARSFAHNTVRKQMKGFRSWGVMGDWGNHWKTMDREFELRQLQVFKAMAERELIYRRYKPVFWSPSSGTALAEAEVEYQEDYISQSAIVKFPTNIKADGLDETIHVVIWTTTPWTLPANQAIAINDGIHYILVRSKQHGLLIVASSRLQYLQEHVEEELDIIDGSFSVSRIAGNTYCGIPEFGEEVRDRPIIHADFVTDNSGTGLVHCAPGHGQEDFDALQALIDVGHVTVKAPVDDQGKFTNAAAPMNPSLLAGLYVYGDGNKAVLDLMSKNGNLLASFKFKHKYTIDWRTKEPVMIRATAQWFADVSSIREATLDALAMVEFKPAAGRSRLRSFVENRSEWCISRQRAWGVPIPALYHKETGEAVLTTESIEHVISVIEKRGIDAWWSDSSDESAWMPPDLSVSDYIRGTDTMDVWFDSGTSWALMNTSNSHPTQPLADVYLEGSDQHRGWFQSSLLTRIAYQSAVSPDKPAQAPFQTLVTHGFTLDANEKKMSKSEGNVIAPDEIIIGLTPSAKAAQPKTSKKHRQVHSLGPDALRLWAASSDWTKDVVISDKVVSAVHNNLDKYRVTLKLLLGMLQDFDSRQMLQYDKLSQLDQIALVQLYDTASTVRTFLAQFEFHKAINSINKWIASDLSGFYFEAIKDVVYCDSVSSLRRQSAQTVIYHIFSQMQHMLCSIVPLLIEESFEHSPLQLQNAYEHPMKRIWGKLPEQWNNKVLESQLPSVMAINSAVKIAQERARAEKLLGQSLGSDVLIYLTEHIDLLNHISLLTLKEIFVVSAVEHLSLSEADFTTTEALQQVIYNQSNDRIRIRAGEAFRKATPEVAWSFVQEVESVNSHRIGFVVVRDPSQRKCSRCWKYEVPEMKAASSAVEQSEQLCQRCEAVVAEYRHDQAGPEHEASIELANG